MTDRAVQFDIFHVHNPQESGENKKNNYIQTRRILKMLKMFIRNRDSLCLPRAVVVARVQYTNHRTPEILNHGKNNESGNKKHIVRAQLRETSSRAN